MICRMLVVLALVFAAPASAGTILTGQIGTTGPASGDLSGNYPSPVVAGNAITPAKMQMESGNTVIGNTSVAAATPQFVALPNCAGVPNALGYTAGVLGTPGAFSCSIQNVNPQFPTTKMFTGLNPIVLTGSGQSGCVNLTNVVNNVTTVPAGGDSTCLPSAVTGELVMINNQTNRNISVFPSAVGTDTINGNASGVSVNLPPNTLSIFVAAGSAKWQATAYLTGAPSDILIFDSAGNPEDGGTLTGDCTSVALVVSCTPFPSVLTLMKPIVMHGYLVSTLPTGSAQGKVVGARAYVTDATSCTFLGSLAGGGTMYCPVTYNGSSWVAG